ncbi:MAG TPA: hypothetical protein DER60_00070 [Syntrophomonas sp.]|jgi:PAS domain S-box-containing protein|nr:hypothetical protein [Syntrophomonas sp.]
MGELEVFSNHLKTKLRLNTVLRLMDVISEGIISFSSGQINWVNHAFTSLTGYNYDEVVGRKFSNLKLAQLTDEQLVEVEESLIKTGKWRGNVQVQRKDGSAFYCQLAVNSLHNEAGFLEHSVAIFTDITGEEKFKQEQLRLQELSAAIQKSASLSAMSAGMVHEITQPLNSIKMIILGLLYWRDDSNCAGTEELYEKLGEAAREIGRIEEIIRHMRSFATLSREPEFEECNINGSIARIMKILSQQLSARGIKCISELTENLPAINANLNRLDAVLINLLTNAMQALDQVEHNKKELICRTFLEERYVVMQIIDNGIGIDERILDCIFEPFVTTKAPHQGMGLGLSVVHNVITRMGGKVAASNNEDRGATFTIKLPAFL